MRTALFAFPIYFALAAWGLGQDEFERAAIEYSLSTPQNVVTQLQERIDRGESVLTFERGHGYLRSLLEALQVRPESQMLVYSKTSLQRSRIAPQTPRAIYFNDDVYLGFCRAGEVMEISVVDPQLGAVFYTLDQKETPTPRLVRQTEKCLQCHSKGSAGEVPSHLVRSLFVDGSGQPIFSEGSHRVDHTTPLADRWGGWYVTGTHGNQAHLGNVVIRGSVERPFKNEKGLNVTNLSGRFAVEQYLTPHSDIVALMVLEHQAMVHNLITNANFATRRAIHYQTEFNHALGEAPDNQLASTKSRIQSAGENLLEGLLFVKEAPIEAPIVGSSAFAQSFAQRGRRDSKGRSLRDFDLTTRMFKYPCSYLIDSAAFDQLPSEVKTYVVGRLNDVLTGKDTSTTFAHLSAADRAAILEILKETKPELWKNEPSAVSQR